jgi:hypothetical protein
MKRYIFALFIIIMFTNLFTTVYAINDESIPEAVIRIAEDSLDKVKSAMAANPDEWGLNTKEEITSATLGGGQLVHFLSSKNLDKASSGNLQALEDSSIFPVWVFTLDDHDVSKGLLEVITSYGGSSYYLLGYGGIPRLFQSTRDQLKQLAQQKGNISDFSLYSIAGRYFFAASDGKTTWALPVPTLSDVNYQENWVANQLWTSEEIIQAIENSVKSFVPGTFGGSSIDFSHIPKIESKIFSIKNIIIYISIGILFAGGIVLFILLWIGKAKKIKKRLFTV